MLIPIKSFRLIVPDGLDSEMVENIQYCYNKARNYMFAYLEGIAGGKELEDTVKRYKNFI